MASVGNRWSIDCVFEDEVAVGHYQKQLAAADAVYLILPFTSGYDGLFVLALLHHLFCYSGGVQ